jgi:hypothetical protein
MIIKYLITRDGREYVMDSVPDWAVDNDDYEVTELVAKESVDGVPINIPNTDDTQERIELMNELFQLQDLEISRLKAQLEKFVEVVEGIVELTEVISQSNIENRSKLLVISESCKKILKPSE